VNDRFVGVGIAAVLEVPAVTLLVVLHARVVVALVQVFEDRREDFGLLIGKIDALVGTLEKLAITEGLKPGRV
jgi:hypothetical protein